MKTAILLILLVSLVFIGISSPSLAQDHVISSSAVYDGSGNHAAAELKPQPIQGEMAVFLPVILQPELLGEFAQQVVTLTNNERANAGCAPLTVNAQLTTAAQGHSEDMAFNDFFSHTGSNGSSPWDRIDATGYQFSAAAENIAAGYQTPESVVEGWMNSQGHRDNILNCNLEEIGVGYYYMEQDTGSVNYYHYWTQVFGTPW